MTADQVIDVARNAIWAIIECSAPMLVVSVVIGLIISIFQTVTSIQEQTLTFVPKFIAIMAVILICGNWILTTLSEYITELFNSFITYAG
ncbi:MAG: flagellar biosynthesis protein FliQ [Lachnospiraceae bacterium]|nr:flagellar biosynthesis protein FliQ [Lachnospiraceae bacterium]